MELQQWKQNFIRDYLDEIDSLEVMDKLEKYTKRILNKKPVALSPIAFNIDEANAEIDIAEKELSEGKGIKEMENLQKEKAFRLPEEGNYSLAGNTRIRIRRYPRTADFTPSKESHRITLDADQVSFPLTYRLTQQGDRFKPFGMKGTKLVSDYLTDRKRNYMEKMSQHVLTDKTGEIIWLIGERTSDHCRITPDTQSILEIELEVNPEV
jgi:hypothetical protein